MKDLDATESSTALALPETTEILPMFAKENGTEPLLSKIEAAVASFIPDTSTGKGRDEIKAMAFKVTKSKTALVAMAATAKEEAAKTVKAVNAETNRVKDRLDALRDSTRKPLTDWEDAETDRVARIKERLERLRDAHVAMIDEGTSEQIASLLVRVEATVVDATWAEFADEATRYKSQAVATLAHMQGEAERREKDAAELVELRAVRAANEAAEAERNEAARIAAEKAYVEKRAAERAEADRIAAEESRAAQAERERVAAEQAAAAEKERAARASKEAEERHARELQEARDNAERESAAERQRIADKQAADDAERAKRAADTAHKDRIEKQITSAIRGLVVAGDLDPKAVCDALMAGEIPHVSVAI